VADKVHIRIFDDVFEVDSGDSILRALQLYGVARDLPSYGFNRFCWNASCQHCVLAFACDGKRTSDYACQTDVREGMRILTLPRVLHWKRKLRVRKLV
jgi:predicted molibdopterin-dependent oxidoreductase YjgC